MKTFWQLTHEERVEMCKNDPEAFELLWKAAIPEGGEQFMWVEQAKLSKYKNPTMRMNKAAESMLQSFHRLNEELNKGI